MNHVSAATPYAWPHDGKLLASNTALIIVDMQRDFCAIGGYVHSLGYDLAPMRAPIDNIRQLLEAARKLQMLVVHTREGHRPDLRDLPRHKRARLARIGAAVGSGAALPRVLTRGDMGHDFIDELTPRFGEPVVDKPGLGAFVATDLELILRNAGVQNLIMAGVCTDICVHSTLRDAGDRGFEGLLVSDATGATLAANHQAALDMVCTEGGIFGAVADTEAVLQALAPALALAHAIASHATRTTRSLERALALLLVDFTDAAATSVSFRAPADCLEAVTAAVETLQVCREAGVAVFHLTGAIRLRRRTDDAGIKGVIENDSTIKPPVNLGGLRPITGERTLDRAGFHGTSLHEELQAFGITNVLICGLSPEGSLETSAREAVDRGYQVCLLRGAVAPTTDALRLEAWLGRGRAQGGCHGWCGARVCASQSQ